MSPMVTAEEALVQLGYAISSKNKSYKNIKAAVASVISTAKTVVAAQGQSFVEPHQETVKKLQLAILSMATGGGFPPEEILTSLGTYMRQNLNLPLVLPPDETMRRANEENAGRIA